VQEQSHGFDGGDFIRLVCVSLPYSTRLKEASDQPTIDTHGEFDMAISLKLRNVSLSFGKGKTKPSDKIRPSLPGIPRDPRTKISTSTYTRRENHLNAAAL
jgi:hypothetical protein